MSIQIIDNFQINNSKPIDNRMVVGPGQFYTTRDSLPYKYDGMRVWDLNDNIPFVWTGSTFSTESASSISGSGTPNHIPKFISPGNVIQDSIIWDNATNVGIGTITPDKKLTVAGDIKSTGSGGFYGIGTNLTNLNATNITSGTLQLTRLQNGTSGYILTAGGGAPIWTNPASITVGDSTNAVNISHSLASDFSSARRLLFIDTTSTSGNHQVKTSTSYTFTPSNNTLYLNGYMGIGTSPSTSYRLSVSGNGYFTGPIGVQTTPNTSYAIQTVGDVRLINGDMLTQPGSESVPSHTFYTDTNTGMYSYGSDSIGFTTGGKLKFRMRSGVSSELEFWNWNGSGGVNGTLINWGNKLSLGGFDYFDIPRLVIGGSIGSKLDVIDNTSSNYVARIYNDATSASSGGGLYIRTNNSSSLNNLLICQRSAGSNVFRVTGNGNCYVGASTLVTSDRRNKENIKKTEGSLDKILRLNPVTFKWIDREEGDVNYGFISQEVKEIYPDIVLVDDGYDDEDNYRFVLNYQSLISELVKSTQEQQDIIKGLEKRIKDLES
jgi:hypothetical protein